MRAVCFVIGWMAPVVPCDRLYDALEALRLVG
jgi:hypothetical protein